MQKNKMNKKLEANLSALSTVNPQIHLLLCNRKFSNTSSRYTFSESRCGETVPFFAGNAKPLHSMIDPKREAQRLVSAITDDTGFAVFLGLGGGFAAQAALESTEVQILVIDYDIDSIAQLFSAKDYTNLLKNKRFSLLIDPSNEEIKNFILKNYKPSISGGIKTIPLRARVELDLTLFDSASEAIKETIETVSADYSVQAHFGLRWFSNIIRNIKAQDSFSQNQTQKYFSSPVHEAAIVAAGPSLDQQLSLLAEYKSRKVFVISSDTALPVLLHHGIKPDTVVSIDCQHISYHHFMGCGINNIPLALDIASPPMLSRLSSSPLFFSSGHPLAQYISLHWKPFPILDTSGGNVTYACLSLAETLGAKRITFFGADFAYINSRTYAKGTYIYPYFEKMQNRFSPAQTLFSNFLYRSPFLPVEDTENNYRETSSLRFYRNKLEEKAAASHAYISCAKGIGAPLNLINEPRTGAAQKHAEGIKHLNTNKNSINFLEQYRNDIAALPEATGKNYLQELDAKNRDIFLTLLPCAAALKHRNSTLKSNELIEEVKRFCLEEIDRVLIS
jgi:hypothetical protein